MDLAIVGIVERADSNAELHGVGRGKERDQSRQGKKCRDCRHFKKISNHPNKNTVHRAATDASTGTDAARFSAPKPFTSRAAFM